MAIIVIFSVKLAALNGGTGVSVDIARLLTILLLLVILAVAIIGATVCRMIERRRNSASESRG